MEKEYAEATELLYKGRKVKGMDFNKHFHYLLQQHLQ